MYLKLNIESYRNALEKRTYKFAAGRAPEIHTEALRTNNKLERVQ